MFASYRICHIYIYIYILPLLGIRSANFLRACIFAREEDRRVYIVALYGVDNCWAGTVCWFLTGVYYAAR